MNNTDDLRTALEVAVNVLTSPTIKGRVDRIEAVLVHPAQRLAILNLIGDVREGWMVASPDPDKETLYVHTKKIASWEVPVFVVRPRGEAT